MKGGTDLKVGLQALVRYTPQEVLTKDMFTYLQPVLNALPQEKRDAFSIVPDEVRRYKGSTGGRARNMAAEVAREAMDQSGLKPEDIDYVLGAEVSIHKALGLKKDVPMLNVSNCCASLLDQLQIAWMLVENGEAEHVLVVASAALAAGGEPWNTTDPTDPISPNFGDGAAAGIVSSENLKCEFLAFDTAIDGRAYHSACGDISPLRNPDLAEAAGITWTHGPFFRMDDITYIKVATEEGYLANSLKRMCEAGGIEPSEINALICHHLGDCEAAWKRDLASVAGSDAAFMNLRLKYGNTGHTDIPMDLLDFLNRGVVGSGSNIILWVPGSGASLAGILLRWY